MGSDESHFNVSLIVRDKVTETVSKNHNPFEEKGEPERNRVEALLLTSLTPYRWAKPAHEIGPMTVPFYTALFSSLEQTRCVLVACNSKKKKILSKDGA